MTVYQVAKQSLRLLNDRDRNKLVAITSIQVTLALFDLFGVLLLGLVGTLAVTTIQALPAPSAVESLASMIGLGSLSDVQLLTTMAAAAAGLLLVKSVLSTFFLRRVFLFLASRQVAVSASLAAALFSRPLTYVQRRSSQETSYALVSGAASATLVVLGQSVVLVAELSLLLVLGALLLVVDPLIALCSIAFFGLVAAILQLALGRWATKSGRDLAHADVASWDSIQEAVNAYREIIVSGRRQLYSERLRQLRWSAAKSSADLQFIGALPKYVFEVALVVGGFALATTLFLTQNTSSAVGTLALFIAAATRIMPAIPRVQGAALTIRNAAGMAVFTLEMAEELDFPSDVTESDGQVERFTAALGSTYRNFVPTVQLKDATFTYPDAKDPAVENVSIEIESGSSLALVGPSGAGKSTLADIILGVLQPQKGEVRVGGLAPTETVERWPGAIACVPQDVLLANSTLRANVALGLPDHAVDDDMVWEALRQAQLVGVVAEGRDGLDTLVGERGVKLSGGQRQRLGLARALYSRPRLIVLDEATSALDAETEMAISKAIAALEGQVTVIIIAHRLSTVRNADTVLYLDNGAALAAGSFEAVRDSVPAFDRQAGLMGLA